MQLLLLPMSGALIYYSTDFPRFKYPLYEGLVTDKHAANCIMNKFYPVRSSGITYLSEIWLVSSYLTPPDTLLLRIAPQTDL